LYAAAVYTEQSIALLIAQNKA